MSHLGQLACQIGGGGGRCFLQPLLQRSPLPPQLRHPLALGGDAAPRLRQLLPQSLRLAYLHICTKLYNSQCRSLVCQSIMQLVGVPHSAGSLHQACID